MPSYNSYRTTIPCQDLARAKAFYSEKLGLEPSAEDPRGLTYTAADGSQFLLFPTSGAPSGNHTQMGLRVDDTVAAVRELSGRGVEFLDYDFEGFDKETHTASVGPDRAAWFNDSEGNLLGLISN